MPTTETEEAEDWAELLREAPRLRHRARPDRLGSIFTVLFILRADQPEQYHKDQAEAEEETERMVSSLSHGEIVGTW
jgi:hypothetical protein